ncbi:MAG: hypothetical protein MZV70_37510 [Desulfobacterales bacterium]|nr:hypothetical protein [Desulfobacterales bacterium]
MMDRRTFRHPRQHGRLREGAGGYGPLRRRCRLQPGRQHRLRRRARAGHPDPAAAAASPRCWATTNWPPKTPASSAGSTRPPASRSSRPSRMLSDESLAFIQACRAISAPTAAASCTGSRPIRPPSTCFRWKTGASSEILDELPERIFFVGHTHLLDILGCDGSAMTGVDFRIGPNPLHPDLKYLDQHRRRRPAAGRRPARQIRRSGTPPPALLDIRCVSYDAQAAAAKIRAAGLPESHARRLLDQAELTAHAAELSGRRSSSPPTPDGQGRLRR